MTDKVAVVHNGIIENYRALREELEKKGLRLYVGNRYRNNRASDQRLSASGHDAATGDSGSAETFEGAFAIGVLFAGHEDLLIGARRGSPLALGYGDGEMYLGSDALALAPLTNRIAYLEEGDWAELHADKAIIHDADDKIVERKIHITALSGAMIGKGQYRHFMLKEIFEQPAVIGDTLSALTTPDDALAMPAMPFDWTNVPRMTIVGCGTASYAGLVAKYWFEQLARLPVELDIASEFRYREAPMIAGGVTIAVSQSGKRRIRSLRLHYAKAQGQKILSVVNVPQSSIARNFRCRRADAGGAGDRRGFDQSLHDAIDRVVVSGGCGG